MEKKAKTAQLKLVKQQGNTICFIILSQAGFLIFPHPNSYYKEVFIKYPWMIQKFSLQENIKANSENN